MQTLPLPRGGREVVSKRPSAQVQQTVEYDQFLELKMNIEFVESTWKLVAPCETSSQRRYSCITQSVLSPRGALPR